MTLFERLARRGEQFGCHRHLCDLEPCGCIATAHLSLGSLVHPAVLNTRLLLRRLDPIMMSFSNRLCNCPCAGLIKPLALSAASPAFTANPDSVVANPSSAPGRSSVVSVIMSFMMSGEPSCTCTSKLHARTSFRERRLYRHSHVYHSIKLLSLKSLYRLLNCTDGWCLVLYHSSDINDP